MGKVQFGLSDVHYAVLDMEAKSYGAVKAIPGAVNLSVDVSGDTNKFYADNQAYAVFDTNSGYTGTLEIATIPDAVYEELLGYVQTAAGEILETTAAKEVHFGMNFRIETNTGNSVAFRYYNCTLSRPGLNHSTTTESTDPTTSSLNINLMPYTMDNGITVVKCHKEMATDAAHTFCLEMVLPTVNQA